MNPYAERMLGLLGERDPLEVLEATPSALEDLFWDLGEKRLDRPWAPEKWTARQIIAHLADVEITYAFRFRQVLAEENHTVQPFDQDVWARQYGKAEASLAIEVFRAVRTWNLGLFRSLGAEDWARVASHPERGEESLAHMLKMMAGHDLNHMAQLARVAAD
jgi:hypothetical protein